MLPRLRYSRAVVRAVFRSGRAGGYEQKNLPNSAVRSREGPHPLPCVAPKRGGWPYFHLVVEERGPVRPEGVTVRLALTAGAR